MREYTDLAFRGDYAAARAVRDSLEPVRRALKSTRPPGKPHAHQKYWQELLGQVGRAGAPSDAEPHRRGARRHPRRVRGVRARAAGRGR